MPQVAARNKAPLLEQLATNPLLIDATKVELFQASVAHVLGHEHAAAMISGAVNAAANDDEDFWASDDGDWRSYYRPYNVKNGVLQIPVMGVLLNRFPYQLGRWATGYKYIEMAVKRGLADDNVKKIAFVVDSPGGEVAGCFEVTDFIYENRNAKPMRSFAADHAYSAAYAIFSATGQGNGMVTRSGGVGSVGVVTAHIDFSGAYEQMGIKITYIFAGAHKVDGNSAEPLPAEVKARIEKRIEKLYSVFTSTVARNRGMDEQAVRDTEALTYDAEDGIEIGFADRLGALEDEMAIFADEAIEGNEQMADKTYSQAEFDTAVASARTEGHAAGVTEGKAAGATEASAAATARMNAVLDSEEGKKRPKAAVRALKTSMSAEEITAFLADLPEEKAEVPAGGKPQGQTGSHFERAMGSNNPEVGDGGEGDDDGEGGDETASNVSSILGAYGSQTGVKNQKRA